MNNTRVTLSSLLSLIFIFTWVSGIVIANGFWSKLIAVVIFPYSWYVLLEHLFKYIGFI